MSSQRQPSALLPEPQKPVALDPGGRHAQAVDTGRTRLLVTGVVFLLAFAVIGGRLVNLTMMNQGAEPTLAHAAPQRTAPVERADVVDRNGIVLATSLPVASLYADPARVLDASEAADKLLGVFPDLDRTALLSKLTAKGRFAWVRRNLTPRQQYDVNRLGIPGLAFQRAERRVYPFGRTLAHVLGATDVDGIGVSGVEKEFDGRLTSNDAALALSIDVRLQSVLERELSGAMGEFKAKGAVGVVMDARSGEVLALSSLPTFDPNRPETMKGDAGFNRATKGVYELGSTFKLFTAAMALDSGAFKMTDRFDAREPIRVARFTIDDFHGEKRWLSLPEVLIYSSNIGAAKMALGVGTETQRDYLRRFGLLDAAAIELPEVGSPLTPSPWREINTMTAAYGHGIAVSPLQLASGISMLVNGGLRRQPTLLKGARAGEDVRVISEGTSLQMRSLMRLVVTEGTGKNAEVAGYVVGGKTGTADKQTAGKYDDRAVISSFVGAFPLTDPRYVVLVVLDEPKGNARTAGYATGGWVAAPSVGQVVRRMAPMMGLMPEKMPGTAKGPQPARNSPLFMPISVGADGRYEAE